MGHWQSPDWLEQSTWERFVGFRDSEYINSLRSRGNKPALPGLARWLARTNCRNDTPLGRPELVKIYIDHYDIPDPRLHGWNWKPPERAVRYEHQELVYEEFFP